MTDDIVMERPNVSSDIARIAFSLFVYVADIARNITAHEARRFQLLLRDPSWTDNQDLRLALLDLKKNYSSLWADYEEKLLSADRDTISVALGRLRPQLGLERAKKLQVDLAGFVERLEHSSQGVRLAKNDLEARSQARRELQVVLKWDDEQPELNRKMAAPSQAAAASSIFWAGGKTKLRCVSVIAETHDTKTYSFTAEPKKLFHFRPGQFVSIEMPVHDEILKRCYTISSSPSRPYTLSVTVKKTPSGKMSNWLFDHMIEGMECLVDGPMGKFTCIGKPNDKLLFIVAGSGVTPAMSMLRWLADTASKASIVFINNVRSPNDIVFHQELLHLNSRLADQMRLAIVPVQRVAGHPWNGVTGRFNEMLLRFCASDFAEREVFTCGPPGYTAAVKSVLSELGFPMDHYHEESFGGPAVAQPTERAAAQQIAPVKISGTTFAAATASASPPIGLRQSSSAAQAVASPKQVKVHLQTRGQSFGVRSGQTILEAAESCGVALENSCRSGVCGACRVRKVSGQVEGTPGQALSEADVAGGYILTCISKPAGDVVLQC